MYIHECSILFNNQLGLPSIICIPSWVSILYGIGLTRGNNENDFAAAQDAAVDVNSDEPLLTGSILTNVNGEWSQSDDRTLNALLELHKN